MIRLAVSVEGQTEEEFVKESLASLLHSRNGYTSPVLIGRARRRIRCGVDVTVGRLSSEMRHLRSSFDAVISMVSETKAAGCRTKL